MRGHLPDPWQLWVLAAVVGMIANLYLFGPKSSAVLFAAVIAFWFGVYLPAGIAYDYYQSDPEERREWRQFVRGLLS
jgi:hypothetical protein